MTDDVVHIITRMTSRVTLTAARATPYRTRRRLSVPQSHALDELALYRDRAIDGDLVSTLIVLSVYRHLHGLPAAANGPRRADTGPVWLEFASDRCPHNAAHVTQVSRLAGATPLFESLWRAWPHRRDHLVRATTAVSFSAALTSACVLADAADTLEPNATHIKIAFTLIGDGIPASRLGDLAAVATALA